MHPVEEMIESLKRLRKGEEVPCKQCEGGIMRAIGNHITTHCYVCDKCGSRINLD